MVKTALLLLVGCANLLQSFRLVRCPSKRVSHALLLVEATEFIPNFNVREASRRRIRDSLTDANLTDVWCLDIN